MQTWTKIERGARGKKKNLDLYYKQELVASRISNVSPIGEYCLHFSKYFYLY